MPDEQTMFNLIKIHSTHTDDKTYSYYETC